MKSKLQFLTATLWLALLTPACGQGTFQNLKFENPILPLDPGYDFITNALPSWTGYIGSSQVEWFFYNDISLGGAAISLHDSMSLSLQPLQGNYSVLLQGSGSGMPTSAAIGQSGLIPQTAQSLRFFATPPSSLQVTFAGQVVPLVQLGATTEYNILGGDISMFAGQTGELRFTALPNTGGFFDNVLFSSQPIPEPSTLGLFAFGALFLGLSYFTKKQ